MAFVGCGVGFRGFGLSFSGLGFRVEGTLLAFNSMEFISKYQRLPAHDFQVLFIATCIKRLKATTRLPQMRLGLCRADIGALTTVWLRVSESRGP